jgi:hypothetical protein
LNRIRRHSKSLDTNAKVCGYCSAPFQLIKSRGGAAVIEGGTPRTPNKFALFVKDNFASVKRSNPGVEHGKIMAIISSQYSAKK